MKVFNEVFTLGFRQDSSVGYNLACTLLENEDPSQAARKYADTFGKPAFLHSSSWRYDKTMGLVITWVTHIPQLTDFDNNLILGEIARGVDPTHPEPAQIQISNVLSHAVRHLAFLLKTDDVFAASLENNTQMLEFLSQSHLGLAGLI